MALPGRKASKCAPTGQLSETDDKANRDTKQCDVAGGELVIMHSTPATWRPILALDQTGIAGVVRSPNLRAFFFFFFLSQEA